MEKLFILLALWLVACSSQSEGTNAVDGGATFHCVGNCNSTKRRSKGIQRGSALCGGHMYPGVTKQEDLKVYQWLLERSKGGDVLVLTADSAPCDIYNTFIYGLEPRPNSVTTICFTSRDGSYLKRTEALIKEASVVFITGGDQAKYFQFWKDTVISKYLPRVPLVGGSSAGLAVQGEFVFTALYGGIDSEEALRYPMDEDVSLTNDFLRLPLMSNVITDTHFFQRDRMGRLVTFMARIIKSKWVGPGFSNAMGVGISEHTAVLIDHSSGNCSVTGDGPVYFIRSNPRVERCDEDDSLTYTDLMVHKWNGTSSATMSFHNWKFSEEGWNKYNLSAVDGHLKSTQPNGNIY